MHFPEDSIGFQQDWFHTIGRAEVMSIVVNRLYDRSAKCFIAKEDQAANELRSMAMSLEAELRTERDRINQFALEARDRNVAVRKQQPGHPGIIKESKTQ